MANRGRRRRVDPAAPLWDAAEEVPPPPAGVVDLPPIPPSPKKTRLNTGGAWRGLCFADEPLPEAKRRRTERDGEDEDEDEDRDRESEAMDMEGMEREIDELFYVDDDGQEHAMDRGRGDGDPETGPSQGGGDEDEEEEDEERRPFCFMCDYKQPESATGAQFFPHKALQEEFEKAMQSPSGCSLDATYKAVATLYKTLQRRFPTMMTLPKWDKAAVREHYQEHAPNFDVVRRRVLLGVQAGFDALISTSVLRTDANGKADVDPSRLSEARMYSATILQLIKAEKTTKK